jgi:hypothetical protein
MPTPAAREAFAKAQEHSVRMHEIHVEELELQQALAVSVNSQEKARLLGQMTQLQSEWLALSNAYVAEMGKFTAELNRHRGGAQ